jgi:hypothetical protein
VTRTTCHEIARRFRKREAFCTVVVSQGSGVGVLPPDHTFAREDDV